MTAQGPTPRERAQPGVQKTNPAAAGFVVLSNSDYFFAALGGAEGSAPTLELNT